MSHTVKTGFRGTIEQARALLKKHWGFDSFRLGQEQIIQAWLEGRDVLGVSPTGSGKSATFQIPALMSGGTAIVVSPLVSLMQDQVMGCRKRGIRAAAINSQTNDQEEVLAEYTEGLYDVVYIAPERLRSRQFQRALSLRPPALVAADEVHSISRFGSDFRPAYAYLYKLREFCPDTSVIAVTATATEEMEADIVRSLKLRPGYARVVVDPVRPNLEYAVRGYGQGTFNDLLSIARSWTPGHGKHLVYAPSRKLVESLCEFLTANTRMAVGFYHAGIDNRSEVHEKFVGEGLDVVCATGAFGMGIDRHDVRSVTHFGYTSTLDDYAQEAGRAGRDGLPATVTLIPTATSEGIRRMQIDSKNPPFSAFEAVWNWLDKNTEPGSVISTTSKKVYQALASTGDRNITESMVDGVFLQLESFEHIQTYYGKSVMLIRVPNHELLTEFSKRPNGHPSARRLADLMAEDVRMATERGTLVHATVDGAQVPLVGFTPSDYLPLVGVDSLSSLLSAIETLESRGLAKRHRRSVGLNYAFLRHGRPIRDCLSEDVIRRKRQREVAAFEVMRLYVQASDRRAYIRDYFMKK